MLLARRYFALQAVAGALWWGVVFMSDDVRRWTLGGLRPELLVVPDLLLFVGASALAAARGGRVWPTIAAGWTVAVAIALTIYATAQREAGWGAVLMIVAAVGATGAALTLWYGQLPVHWFFVGPFAFVPSPEGPPARHLRRSLTQLVVFWSSFLIALPLLLNWVESRWRLEWPPLEHPPWSAVGVAVFAVGSALGLWSCTSMALRGEGTPLPAVTARRLVVVGPYRLVRNPMAVAGALQTVGVGLWVGSWMVLVSAAAGALIWNTYIRPREEADLVARFGSEYEQYARAVACWVPRPARR